MMSSLFDEMNSWIQSNQARSIGLALLILAVGILVERLFVRRVSAKKKPTHKSMVLRKIASAAVLAVTLILALHALGFDPTVLLGAAGILTVALGFASQTSASNIISGVFLMGEHSFQVGDLIQVGDKLGYVLDIDYLSVKLRTFDNLLVRIPNETMLKTEVTNLTRFPIRRVDLQIGVAYKEDLSKVRDLLLEIAEREPMGLDEPKPNFLFTGYGNSALEFQFSVWTTQDNFYKLRTKLYLDIKKAFDEHGIEIPFPHVSLYAGSITDPLPIRLIERPEEQS